MKTIFRMMPFAFAIIAVLAFYSCEKKNADSGTGKLAISLDLSDDLGQLKSAVYDSIYTDTIPPDTIDIMSFHLMISVEDMEGNPVLTDELIPMYQFGSGFVSEDVELRTGEYNLTKFLVINPSGQVVFAAPLAGSPLAYLVNRPLPLHFVINADRVTTLIPEVLPVLDHPPDQFGYVNFGVQVVKPLVFYAICHLDNPIIMPPVVPTDAILTVYGNNWHYTFKLAPAVNRIIIRGGSEIYTFILEKPGYETQKLQFTARQLMATSKDNPLILKIPAGSQYQRLVLQPGPEIGKDAMVSNLEPNKNFGKHPYFEATFLSEPILTVMRSNRSMIWFNMNAMPKSATIHKVTLTLFYDVPLPWDSTIMTYNGNPSDFAWYGAVLQQIVEPWREDSVTWNTQPKSIETNQVYISPFIRNVNFIEVDVTKFYVPQIMTDNGIALPNYGMLFKLYPSEQFAGFRFTSSDYPVANMRPKLSIYYTMPV